MNQFFERIGHAITSMAAVIFVLFMTIIAGVFFSRTLFHGVLPREMQEWEKIGASYALAIAWELTILVTVTNVSYLNRRLPIVMAICSGVILLFFIHAFDTDLSLIEYVKRWFIGLLVATMNISFAGLFYRKWQNLHQQKDLNAQIAELENELATRTTELANNKSQLSAAKADFDQLFTYTKELESFKAKELEKLKCPYCHGHYETIFKLTSHKGVCNQNPKKGMKQSVFEEA
jgi:hypothetical protein